PLKARTRVEYQALFDRLIVPTLGKAALIHLTPESIRVWHAGLGSEHVRRDSHAYGWLLHAIPATAVTDQLIPANPANLRRAMNPPTKRQPVILDVTEVAALADAVARAAADAGPGPGMGRCALGGGNRAAPQ
ncbi:MAG TPA: hypothetical protein VE197_14245, partial [Mycobacterium sp.]|nr:hypothetical protein [Mycobacterium sp.]